MCRKFQSWYLLIVASCCVSVEMIVMGEYVLIKCRYNKAFNKGSVLFPIDVFRINKEFRILAITF
jgi:hypothetical protein